MRIEGFRGRRPWVFGVLAHVGRPIVGVFTHWRVEWWSWREGPLKREEGCGDLVCDLVLQGLYIHGRERPDLSLQSDNTVKSEKGIGKVLTDSFAVGRKSSERG